ncbi:imp-2 [Pristionchus pacificus]|uniref:Imp-2 n=1 Tax=Pristionchus pacificus TaxID=54126 RepID=A0A2A6BWN5_PRIPA|nr:imp-2 [Pristionchus pacificus]|eukprot:PDM70267.1 imp-2 [Pristionchus pacificus]
MAQAVPTTPAPTTTTETPIVYTFEEQVTASFVLYGLSFLCIVIGAVRSARLVRKTIEKGRNKMEGSITMKEARWFPISASVVLFGLYCFFNPDKMTWSNVEAHFPTQAMPYLTPLREKYVSYTTGEKKPNFVVEMATKYSTQALEALPPNVRVVGEEFIEHGVMPLWEYVPSITKVHCAKALLLLLCFQGCVALAALLKPFFSFFIRFLPFGFGERTPYIIAIKKGKKEMEEGDIEEVKRKEVEYLFKAEWDWHDAIAIAFCSIVGISHLYKRHWITNNLLGVAFSIFGIEHLHLSSFKAGTFLLIALFFYDIFWVFATDVMTTVAKGIDAPILLQFPQDIYRNGWVDANKYSMLGLGDIVIPGLFIALLRRFDQRVGDMQFIEKALGAAPKDKQKGPATQPKKTFRIYFYITVFAYMAGLFITMAVMHHFKRAQPALLYLVPVCLFVPLMFSVCRGEFSALWNYSEDHLVEKDDESSKKKKVTEEKKKN